MAYGLWLMTRYRFRSHRPFFLASIPLRSGSIGRMVNGLWLMVDDDREPQKSSAIRHRPSAILSRCV